MNIPAAIVVVALVGLVVAAVVEYVRTPDRDDIRARRRRVLKELERYE